MAPGGSYRIGKKKTAEERYLHGAPAPATEKPENGACGALNKP